MTNITSNNAAEVNPTPFHADNNSDHLKNLNVAYDRRHNQNTITC